MSSNLDYDLDQKISLFFFSFIMYLLSYDSNHIFCFKEFLFQHGVEIDLLW